jgi:hypothetical protein
MAAGVAHWPAVTHREDLPTPIQTWRVPTLSYCSWGTIARVFSGKVVVLVELDSQKAIELLLSMGVHLVDGDIGVMLEFPDQDAAYQLIRYVTTNRLKAAMYLDGMRIEAWSGVEFALYSIRKYPEWLLKNFTEGQKHWNRTRLKILELENNWLKAHLR